MRKTNNIFKTASSIVVIIILCCWLVGPNSVLAQTQSNDQWSGSGRVDAEKALELVAPRVKRAEDTLKDAAVEKNNNKKQKAQEASSLPDLSIDMGAAHINQENEEIAARFTVYNAGSKDVSSVPLSVFNGIPSQDGKIDKKDESGIRLLKQEIIDKLKGGASKPFTVAMPVAWNSQMKFYGVIDGENAIEEADEKNNTTQCIVIFVPPHPDEMAKRIKDGMIDISAVERTDFTKMMLDKTGGEQ
ncbi:MAG: CARDB domain-containing protein [Candidatus Omnitrophota bacterium]